MCGVVGVVGPGVDASMLRAGIGAIRHRGPDGEGVFVDPARVAGLAHARLALVGIADGAQPIASEDGRVVVSVNGEIYGHAALRAELEARGHRFRTHSDSEVALHLYEEHGDAFVEHLRGELAMVLWDGARRRLLAARDRFGVKPLVWAAHDRRVLVASEAKALFAMGVPARWDARSLAHVATHQYLPPSRTMFAGVFAVPPAHVMVVERGEARLRRYWDPARRDPRPSTPEELDAALEEAVRLRARAEAPVAFALSGGLDSASVVALSGVASPRTFGVRFDGAAWDESSFAREVATHVGAEHEVVDVSRDVMLDALPDAVASSEGLAINGQLPAKLALARAIERAGCKAVLTGEGADEALLGYPHLVMDALRDEPDAQQRARLEAESGVCRGVMLADGRPPRLATVERALGFVPSWLEAKALLGARVQALLADGVEVEPERVFGALLAEVDLGVSSEPRPARSAWLWTQLALAGYILRTLGDGTEMAASVEGRTPFLDHHVFEVALRLPLEARIRDGVEKHALRARMRGRLPERVVTRRKHPFLAPPLLGADDPRVMDVLRSGGPSPFFDRERVEAALVRQGELSLEDRAAAEPALMLAFTATLLQRRFGLGDAR